MSHKQDRIINSQQRSLKKAHIDYALLQEAHERLKSAASMAVIQIDKGFGHCAANKLREALKDINASEASNDNH
ncbi:hypothetical protein [Marinobacterium stanieri]|uniref:hypothetical protein n=1 Tax=Marinobacterium stanieri TaxID=49186 RepID=UPI0002557825|nr:hypothetical protein [Marinobacterium stanieri]